MAMEITLSSSVDRSNVLIFSQAVQSAIVQSLNSDGSSSVVYDEQVAIDQILTDGVSIWRRPRVGQIANRRLLSVAQRLVIEFTFLKSYKTNAMELTEMLEIFKKQLTNPSSPLMAQPLFAGAVVHKVTEVDNVDTSDLLITPNTKIASSALAAAPTLFALLALLW